MKKILIIKYGNETPIEFYTKKLVAGKVVEEKVKTFQPLELSTTDELLREIQKYNSAEYVLQFQVK